MRTSRNIALVFCMLLVASPVVFSIVFQLQEIVLRKEMKQKLHCLEQEQLVTLHLGPSDIHWYKKDKELQIGDELFDVKTLRKTKYGYTVTGLFDKKEKELKKAIEQLAGKAQKQRTEKLVAFLQLVYHSSREEEVDTHYNHGKPFYPSYTEEILFGSYPVLIPPPKVSLVS